MILLKDAILVEPISCLPCPLTIDWVQPWEDTARDNQQKLSTNLTLSEAYTNQRTNLRRAETKRKKEFNLES